MTNVRLLVLALAALGGCRATESIAPLPAGELQAAPLAITVGGQTLTLVTELWRDFMPVTPPNGKPLFAVMRVRAANGGALTATFQVDALWIVNGAETWATAVTEENVLPRGAAYHEWVARDGPKWNPGVRVDVIVRVREASGATQLLRAANQLIQRSD